MDDYREKKDRYILPGRRDTESKIKEILAKLAKGQQSQ